MQLRTYLRFVALAAAVALAVPAAAHGANSRSALYRVYRGDDGAAYYQTVTGATVVGFGEHPGKGYAFVMKGKRSADGKTIVGQFWDVAKGSRTQRGAVRLAVSQAGARLRVTNGAPIGPVTLDAYPADKVPWPGYRVAGFQSTSARDLDGAFHASDHSMVYARDVAGTVAWVAEGAGKPGGRPRFASVFIGERTETGIHGSWWDVPKGTRSDHGWFGAATLKTGRRTRVSQDRGGLSGSHDFWLDPDYRVDLDRFATEIDDAFDGNVTGYGWAIAKDGKVVREGGGGLRRLDLGLPFNAATENEAASTTKLVTAATIIRALEWRGKSVDDTVAPYLPKNWAKGPGVKGLTFRQLLDHTAALYYPGKTTCRNDPYACLKIAFERGRTRETESSVSYHNIHYGVLRVLLAFVVAKPQMDALFANEKSTAKLNAGYSRVFCHYASTTLQHAGVTGAFEYLTSNHAYWYDFASGKLTQSPDDGCPGAGPGSLRISAREYTKFLAALAAGRIVSPKAYAAMKSGYLGFDLKGSPGILADGLGEYWRKNGGCGAGCGSQAVVLPDNVQAYVTYNSSGNTLPSSAGQILRGAYAAALG